MNAGPSTPSSSAQVNITRAELKSKIVRVIMRGGFWESSDVGERLFSDSNIGDVVSIVPDGVDGSTHAFFISFPSAEMAAAQMEAWTTLRDWEYSLISDDELNIYLAYTESLADAVQRGVQVPATLGQMPCASSGSPIQSPGSLLQTEDQGEFASFGPSSIHSSNVLWYPSPLHQSTLMKPGSPSDDEGEGDEDDNVQLAIIASLRPPTPQRSRTTSPPSKRRRISEDGSSVPTGPSLPPTFTAADVWAAMEDLHEDLQLEWIPNQRTSKPSEKALGKRPER